MTDPDDAYAVISEANWLLAPASDAETLFQLLDYIASSYAPSARPPPDYGCSTAAVRTAIGALAASGGHVTLIECSAPLLGVGRVSASEQSAVYGTEDESSMYLRSQDEAYYSELGVTCAMASVCVDFVVASKEHVHLAEQQMLASQSGGSVYLVKDGAAGLAELHAYLQVLVLNPSARSLSGRLRLSEGLNLITYYGGVVNDPQGNTFSCSCMTPDASIVAEIGIDRYIKKPYAYAQFAVLFGFLCGG